MPMNQPVFHRVGWGYFPWLKWLNISGIFHYIAGFIMIITHLSYSRDAPSNFLKWNPTFWLLNWVAKRKKQISGMYARNMEHLIIYTAFGFAHDIQLINHLVYTKTPRRLNRVYSPLDFWIGFDQIRWYSHSNPHPYPEFGELPINHHRIFPIKHGFSQGFRRCFASQKFGGPDSRFAVQGLHWGALELRPAAEGQLGGPGTGGVLTLSSLLFLLGDWKLLPGWLIYC